MRNYCFLILLPLFLAFPGCAYLSKITPDRLAAHSGFSWSAIDGDDIQTVPAAIRIEFNTNELIQLSPKYGRLNIGIEAFGNSTIEPELGLLVGVAAMIKYSYDVNDILSLYLEGGAGPNYLSLGTYEQSKSGFNFYDQIGAGIELRPGPRSPHSLILGYRFGHISHAGLRSSRNRGIETDTIIFGFSTKFGD
jgi:lipid A 3-O-deacylase